MKNVFHYHLASDVVRVIAGACIYVDTTASFVADNGGIGLPDIPAPGIERIYEPNVRHTISDGNSVIAGGPIPWGFGDRTIANIAALRAAQTKRTAPIPKATTAAAATRRPSGTHTVAF